MERFKIQSGKTSGFEWALDASRKLNEKFILSAGIGQHQTEIVSFRGFESFGAGLSLTWLRPKKFLSSPQIGFQYLTEERKALLLLKSGFY